jgi:hypothetical protein
MLEEVQGWCGYEANIDAPVVIPGDTRARRSDPTGAKRPSASAFLTSRLCSSRLVHASYSKTRAIPASRW